MPNRILVADDNALVRNALRQVLHEAGPWEVIEATDGNEAVAMAKEFRPDLVILDLAMPIMDGMIATRHILQAQPDLPVLMHTLYWSPRIEVEALKAGVRKVVRKSESSVVVAAVHELLNSKPPPASNTTSPHGTGPTIVVILNPENLGKARKLGSKSGAAKADEPDEDGKKRKEA